MHAVMSYQVSQESFSDISVWQVHRTLKVKIIPSQGGPGNIIYEEVLQIEQIHKTRSSPSDVV